MTRARIARLVLIGFGLGVSLVGVAGCSLPVGALVTRAVATPVTTPGVSAVSAPQPAIVIHPPQGQANTAATVTGTGFPPGVVVSLYLAAPLSGAAPQRLGTAKVSAGGAFRSDFLVPQAWANGRPIDEPELVIVAGVDGSVEQAAATFGYVVPATPAPPTGSPTDPAISVTAASLKSTPAQEAATPAPTGPPNYGWVRSLVLDLRAGPSPDYPSLSSLNLGTPFVVTGQTARGDWLYVVLSSGAQGWVDRSDTTYDGSAAVFTPPPLTVVPSPTPTASPPPTPSAVPSTTLPSTGAVAPALTSEPAVTPESARWLGEYFDNPDLAGRPVLTRRDGGINFDWAQGSPAPGLPATDFSVRWTGTQTFSAGTYRFHVVVDDGARVYVDGGLVIDAWYDSSRHEVTGDVVLGGGEHGLRVEYYQHAGEALISLWWEQLDLNATSPYWKGEYYDNQYLDGDPLVVRNDPAINFNWGNQPPAAELPAEHYSVRWIRSSDFTAGTYEFSARADDGIRVLVDGQAIIDQWHDGPGWDVYKAQLTLSGPHLIVVEYYQDTGHALAEVWWYEVNKAASPTPTARPTVTLTPKSTPRKAPAQAPGYSDR